MQPYQYGPPEDPGPRSSRRRKRPVWPWVTGVVVLVVIAALILAFETINGQSQPPGVSVPSVVGDKLNKAEQILQKHGFKVKAIANVTTTGAPNQVTATSPAAESLAPRGTTVKVTYNTRPGAKALPPLRGLTESAATAKLAQEGWTQVSINPSKVPSLTVPVNSVVSTSPAAGAKISLSSPIVLNVSGGGVKVPSVYDQQASDAEAAIRGAGLAPVEVNNQSGPPGAAPGTVWQIKPNAGTVVLPGSSVTIYVVPAASSPPASPSSPPPSSPPPSSPPPSPGGSPSPSSPPQDNRQVSVRGPRK
jgi:eukaryotic-like serine/threonine-protein kinase